MTVFAPLVILWAGSTPTPVPAYVGDVNLITPGVVGFAVTFLIAIATVQRVIAVITRQSVGADVAGDDVVETIASAVDGS